ncbi:MAG: metal-dependent hydrolase [Mariprofundaceae bacterium]|nr:metal-dependent hydrolase [Mariprofundaceae bacterium]
MDPLTHAISGALLARALPRKPLPIRHLMLLILLTMAPDADFALRFISDTAYLQYHRSVTHSLLMLPLWTWLFYSLLPTKRARRALAPWLIGMAIALHIFLDLITSFGTMILAPVSDWRAALDLVFIIDPLFTACLLLPLLAACIWRNKTRALACTGLLLAGAYLGLTVWTQAQAVNLARFQQPGAQDYAALPLQFSPFHWQLIAVWPEHYTRSAVKLWPGFSGSAILFPQSFTNRYMPPLQAPEKLNWQQLPRMAAHDLDQLPGVTFYRWFARFPVLLAGDKQHLEFGDLRFGAGVKGAASPFRLYIELGEAPKAWLIWREGQRSALP